MTNNEPTQSLCHCAQNDLLTALLEIRELNDRVKKLWVKAATEQTQLPIEIIQPIVEKSFVKKRLNRPLLEGEIKHALSKTKTMEEAAEYLNVSPKTLKHYCQLYDENKAVENNNDLPLWTPTRGSKTVKRKNV